jgi:protein phosphatase PTC7
MAGRVGCGRRPRAVAWGGGVSGARVSASRPSALRFYAASSNIAHPDKSNNGEDACYITECGTSLGVSDGVGGWLELGVDSGLYSRELCMAAARTVANTGETDPRAVMQAAYDESNSVGTATFCCLTLEDNVLRAANLGDSRFVLLRPNANKQGLKFVCLSTDQQHFFNCPRQLGTNSLDMPHHADLYELAAQPGDIVVVGTDGLWDNLEPKEIMDGFALTGYELPCDEPTLVKVASHLTTAAFLVSRSTEVDTPFARNARRNNFNYSGGKLDDITVVVAVIQPVVAPSPHHHLRHDDAFGTSDDADASAANAGFVLPRSVFSMDEDEGREEQELERKCAESSPVSSYTPASCSASSQDHSPYSSYDDAPMTSPGQRGSADSSPYASYEEGQSPRAVDLSPYTSYDEASPSPGQRTEASMADDDAEELL